jgi:hypothetical protein
MIMSDFKNKMIDAQQTYKQQSYPGNLAADVLGRRRRVWPWLLPACAAAVVAGLLFLIGQAPTAHQDELRKIVKQTKPPVPQKAHTSKQRMSRPRLTQMPSMAKVKPRIRLTTHMPKLRFGSVSMTGYKYKTRKKEKSNEIDPQKKYDSLNDADRGAGSGGIHRHGAGVCT